MDEVKAAIFGHAVGEELGVGEMVQGVNPAGGLGVGVADLDNPSGDFLAVLVTVGLRAVEIDGAERAGVGKFCGCDGHKISG